MNDIKSSSGHLPNRKHHIQDIDLQCFKLLHRIIGFGRLGKNDNINSKIHTRHQ